MADQPLYIGPAVITNGTGGVKEVIVTAKGATITPAPKMPSFPTPHVTVKRQ